MGINSTEVAYHFGQMGSMFSDSTTPLKAPLNKVIIAITMLADTTFADHGGLQAEQDSANGLEYISTQDASGVSQTAHDIAHGSAATAVSGAGGLIIEVANVFPKGITIYGRWTQIDPASGTVIAYIGD